MAVPNAGTTITVGVPIIRNCMWRVWSNYKFMLKGTCSAWNRVRPRRECTTVVNTSTTRCYSLPAVTIFSRNVFIAERYCPITWSTYCGGPYIIGRARRNWWWWGIIWGIIWGIVWTRIGITWRWGCVISTCSFTIFFTWTWRNQYCNADY